MADYRTIADAEVDPDAPLTSSLGYAWRDNPIAIAEGATGAPRVEDSALSNTVTSAGSSWVFNRIINRVHQGVGQSVLCQVSDPVSTETPFGSIRPGSQLRPSSADGVSPGVDTLPGSWRCMGTTSSGSGNSVSLFQRVS